MGAIIMKITQKQRDWLSARRKIDDELRKQIELDEEFQKKTNEEKANLLMKASLMTGHNLIGDRGIQDLLRDIYRTEYTVRAVEKSKDSG